MTKSSFPNPLEIYSPILIFSAATLIALTSSRLLLTALYWSRVEAVNGFYFIILQGIRFDFIIVCALVVPVTILQPFLRDRAVFRQVSQLYLLFFFVVIVFMEAATPTFIGEYDQRPNILFVEYLKYPKEVALMLWGGFKLDITIGLICVVALAWAFNKFLSPAMKKSTVPTFFQAILYSMIVMSICFIGIRSSFGHRPANPAKVAFSVDLLANDLALNSIYSTAYAIYSSIRHERDVQAYGKMEMESVLQLIHDDMALPKSEFLSRDLPTLHRSQWVTPKEKPMNLVIILQESLGAEFVGALGGTDVTPELDALSTQGIWFNNLYATGTRSVRGIEAITTGFTPTPARSVVKLPKSQSGFFTIAELLQRRGYDTSFIYGGEAHFDNMRQFFVGNGFEHIIEQRDFSNPTFKGSWGVSDQDLFDKAHAEFESKGDLPFFSLVFTSSNHTPFEFPDGDFELYEQPRATVNNAVKYADYAMGEYFRKARQSGYWENTLFLVVADHNSRVRGANLVPIEYFHIPALILGGSIKPQLYPRMASQIDLLPTLLGMMGIDDAIPATGHDLFRPDIAEIPGRAIMQYNSTQAFMQGNKVVVMEMGKAPAVYVRTESGLSPYAGDESHLLDKALAYSIWSSTAYKEQLYRLPSVERVATVQHVQRGDLQ